LASDGRGLQDVHINDHNFAKFSEALYIADRHSQEEVHQRALMQQKLAQKEKAAKEENLCLLAQCACEEHAGITPSRPMAGTQAAMKSSLGAYGSDSGSASGGNELEEEEAAKVHDEMHGEKQHEHEREMRMSNMGTLPGPATPGCIVMYPMCALASQLPGQAIAVHIVILCMCTLASQIPDPAIAVRIVM
jgi:SNW domain-containing protein 1